MRATHPIRAMALVAALVLTPVAIPAAEAEESHIVTTPHFTFFSDFDTNLNDALIVAGTARSEGSPELFGKGEEKACFEGLAPSARAGWNLAVDYYAEIISPVEWNKRQRVLLRYDLAGLERHEDPHADSFLGIAHGFLSAASPAYRECRWKTQDAENRAWIHDLMPHLKAHEEAIGGRLETLYAMKWDGLPMRVDMVSTAPTKGADTWILDPGGHILVSSAVERELALETVFHEASHTLAAPWRPDPLPKALEDAAKQLDMKLPGDLWHVVLFYTTGQAVRRILAESGEPDYAPFMEAKNLWTGSWARYRHAIETTWPAYMDGKSDLNESALALMKALGSQEDAGR